MKRGKTRPFTAPRASKPVEINKTLKKKINKVVKDTILDIAHRELLDDLLMKHLTLSVAPAEEMVHYLKPTMQELMFTNNVIKVGDWVEVLYDYAPGTCSDGGVGEIMAIDEDEDGIKSCRVAYVLDKRIETRVGLNRITVTMMPFKDTTSTNRTRREHDISSASILPDRAIAAPDKTPLQWLESGLKSRSQPREARVAQGETPEAWIIRSNERSTMADSPFGLQMPTLCHRGHAASLRT
jgi:hypothetical protein